MRIDLTESFQRDVSSLSKEEKSRLFDVMLKLPSAVKTYHVHSGIGLRKIHSSGVFEARIGLSLRMVFGFDSQNLTLHRVGGHDTIGRYLKSL